MCFCRNRSSSPSCGGSLLCGSMVGGKRAGGRAWLLSMAGLGWAGLGWMGEKVSWGALKTGVGDARIFFFSFFSGCMRAHIWALDRARSGLGQVRLALRTGCVKRASAAGMVTSIPMRRYPQGRIDRLARGCTKRFSADTVAASPGARWSILTHI